MQNDHLPTLSLDHRCTHLGHSDDTADGHQHVVFGIDRSFLRHAAMVILSILRHNSGQAWHFHLISCADLGYASQELEQLIRQSDHRISLYQLSQDPFSHLPQSTRFPVSTYYRLMAPLLLGEPARLLYLDADMICLGSLTPLLSALDGRREIVAAVSDQAHSVERQVRDLGLPARHYFNSGMLLIDAAGWREARISERAVALLGSHGHAFRFPDQDALNILLQRSTHYVDGRFNTLFELGHSKQSYCRQPATDTVLLHYIGADKPWQRWNCQVAVRHYREIHATSPWAHKRFDRPRQSRQAKRMYTMSFKQGHWLDGLYWFARYLIERRRKSC